MIALYQEASLAPGYSAPIGVSRKPYGSSLYKIGIPLLCRGHSLVPHEELRFLIYQTVGQFKYPRHILPLDLKDNSDTERKRWALTVRPNIIARRFATRSGEVNHVQSLREYTNRAYMTLGTQYNNVFRVLMGLPCF